MNETYDKNTATIEKCYSLAKNTGVLICGKVYSFYREEVSIEVDQNDDLTARYDGEIVVSTHWRELIFVPGNWTKVLE